MVNIFRAVWEWTLGNRHPRWRVGSDGVIYFTAVSNGWKEQWIKYFRKRFNREYLELLEEIQGEITPFGVTEAILRSPNFQPTKGVKVEVAVLPWWFFSDDDRITLKILAEAERRKLFRPNAEVACLTRKMFTNQELTEMVGSGNVVVMSDPISDEVVVPGGDIVLNNYSIFGFGAPSFLATDSSYGSENLDSYSASLSKKWPRETGFVFGHKILS